ncbi:membrane or secreted protein [gut metagenome]|uniref:Membrane or secreted protein n=1 Tax=gut metagenome TaxID=749906 RepID=J9FK73_9ZZZZ
MKKPPLTRKDGFLQPYNALFTNYFLASAFLALAAFLSLLSLASIFCSLAISLSFNCNSSP